MRGKIQRKVLKNGLTVVFEKRELPVVSMAFAVRYGGAYESQKEKGISHFIEHMLYKGTPTRIAQQIAQEIELKGGILNGFTSESITAFWCKMPSKNLSFGLNVLSDMVKNPVFDSKELEKEREVIIEEIKMYHDNPRMYVLDKIKNILYKEPVGMDIIGTIENLRAMKREHLVEKFKQVYKPSNMILCVIGNADFKKLCDFCEKFFEKERSKLNIIVPAPVLQNGILIEKRKDIDQVNLVFAYHVPKKSDRKNYAAQVLTTLMAGGMSSRLFNEIREKRNLAYAVKGISNIEKDFGYSEIYIGTSKENYELVKKVILEEYEKVSKNLTEKELNEIKEQLIGNYHIGLEDSTNRLVEVLGEEISGTMDEDFEKCIREVKLSDVRNLAKLRNYSFFALLPEN